MGFDASQALRYAADQALALPSILGVSQYAVFLITVSNDQVDINETDTQRLVSKKRIVIADGYRAYSSADGYLNPMLSQEEGEQLIISAGKLTANRLLLGPLVFPYTLNNFSGGFDPQLLQPANGGGNKQVYIQIQGIGLSPSGNFFTIKELVLDQMSNISYSVVLQSNLLSIV